MYFPGFILWLLMAWLAWGWARGGGILLAFLRPRMTFRIAFFGVLGLALLCWRYDVLVYPYQINLDETQFTAQALGYFHHWLPFSQDAHTSGPLNCYILTWPLVLGFPATYFTSRLTSLALVFLTLIFVVLALSRLVGERRAPLFALPLITFYLCAYQKGLVHYSSEDLPLTLLAAALWLLTSRLWRPQVHPGATLAFGALLGAVPFAKIQAGPLAVFLFLVGLVLVWRQRSALLALIAGGFLVPGLITLPLVITGQHEDMTTRYIQEALHYDSRLLSGISSSRLQVGWELIRTAPQQTLFQGIMVICSTWLAWQLWRRRSLLSRSWLTGLAVAVLYLALSIGVVLKTGLPYSHYVLFFPIPALLVAAWLLRGWLLSGGARKSRALFPRLAGIYLLFCLLPFPLYVVGRQVVPYLTEIPPEYPGGRSPVAEFILKHSQPGDAMAIWGYTPLYYVETQLPPAAHDHSNLLADMPGARFDFYREALIRDLRQAPPKIIIDTVGDYYLCTWPHPLERARATGFAPLAKLLAEKYTLAAQIPVLDVEAPVLIYVRK